jgi:Reverse transcriptase (RNA-dependent DNA polymerase).
MNDTDFFYQWQVVKVNQEKFMIVSHQELETSNVVLMKLQRIIFLFSINDELNSFNSTRILHRFYIDDLIIFSKILNEHKEHLNTIWFLFDEIEISLNEVKIYLDYSL